MLEEMPHLGKVEPVGEPVIAKRGRGSFHDKQGWYREHLRPWVEVFY